MIRDHYEHGFRFTLVVREGEMSAWIWGASPQTPKRDAGRLMRHGFRVNSTHAIDVCRNTFADLRRSLLEWAQNAGLGSLNDLNLKGLNDVVLAEDELRGLA